MRMERQVGKEETLNTLKAHAYVYVRLSKY